MKSSTCLIQALAVNPITTLKQCFSVSTLFLLRR